MGRRKCGKDEQNEQMESPQPYSPLRRRELAEMVANKLLSSSCVRLSDVVLSRFAGAGVYALYYQGDFPLYRPIAHLGLCKVPIYIGKAEVEGRRTGKVSIEPDVYTGDSLYRRLREHYRSIHEADNLDVMDFYCRFLVLEDIWIPLAEALLIQRFQPLWNGIVPGFGIHDPGGGRKRQRRSDWDMLHPGRRLAMGLPEGTPPEQIAKRVRQHLNNILPQLKE